MELCYFSDPTHKKQPAKRVYVQVTQTSQQTMKQYKLELARRRTSHQAKPKPNNMMSKADYLYNR